MKAMIGNRFSLLTEDAFSARHCKHYEGAFTQGSGYLSVRGSFEEGLMDAPQDEEYVRLPANVTLEAPRHPLSKWGAYLPGVMGQHPILKEEMINLPSFLSFIPLVGDEKLDMCHSKISNYRRTLNLRTGELERTLTWHTHVGAILKCDFRRTVDMAKKRFCVQEITMTALSQPVELSVQAGLDGNVRTNGFCHFQSVNTWEENGLLAMDVQTDNDHVSLRTCLICNGKPVTEWTAEHRRIMLTGSYSLHEGDTLTFCKISGVAASRDLTREENLAASVLRAAANPTKIWERSRRAWEDKWQDCEVELRGDDELQQAINFSIYHLLRSNAEHDPRVAICAKGHAGEAYFGRYFWDTEAAMFPFFLYTNPHAAKNLIKYRYRTLPGARDNAKSYGYQGARYPWESGLSGTEQCAAWNYCDHEIHITADVIYALRWYCRMTADQDFLFGAGAEMLVETARYWISRAYQSKDGTWHLNGVMGPDEYLMEVNDDAYTNAMVKMSLDETLRVLKTLEQKRPSRLRELVLQDGEADAFQQLADGLVQQFGSQIELVMQCQGFDELEDVDFDNLWSDRTRPFGCFISQERNYRSKALKQGDVVQLMTMLPELFTQAQMETAYEYYLPMTTHDSSLSAGVHAILSARLGKTENTIDFLHSAAAVDMEPSACGAAEGIHIANCGNLWQALVFGVAGLSREPISKPKLTPHLPDGWSILRFRFLWNGKRMEAVVFPDGYQIVEVSP